MLRLQSTWHGFCVLEDGFVICAESRGIKKTEEPHLEMIRFISSSFPSGTRLFLNIQGPWEGEPLLNYCCTGCGSRGGSG